jgi:hypothetical protein
MRLLTTLLVAASLAACGDAETKSGTETPKGDTVTNNSTASTPALNTLTDAEKTEGWQLLFDGTSKNGWHVYNKTSDGAAWKVVDGALFLDSNYRVDGNRAGGGDLVTDEEYENFELALEWKIDSGGNSGVIFLVNEDKKYGSTYHTGPEMQVLDNAAHKDASIVKHRAGDLYDLVTSTPETVKKAGEWNAVRIVLNKGALEFHLNGSKVVSTTMWDDNWNKMVAASKFKAWKDFATYKKGRIALQDHGDPVWYRNIKIKKLQ